jgi:hypothetical protein
MPFAYQRRNGTDVFLDEELFADRYVMMFDPQLERAESSVSDSVEYLRTIHATSLELCDHVVIRGSGAAFAQRMRLDQLARAYVREFSRPVSLLYGSVDARHLGPRQRILVPTQNRGMPLTLEDLRNAELLALLGIHGGFLEAEERHHFVLPSREHAPAFIRVGDALRDFVTVRRIAEWVLPLVHEDTAILADTGAMLPLLLEVQRVVQDLVGWRIPVDTLSSYPVGRFELIEAIAAFTARVPMNRKLFLVSVNSSGRLLDKLQKMTSRGDKIAVLYDSGIRVSDSSVVVMGSKPIQRWPVLEDGTCANCRNDQAILIDPSSFERKFNVQYRSVNIPFGVAEINRPFWQAVSASQAVRLHHNTRHRDRLGGRARHFPVYIDMRRLLGVRSIKLKLTQMIREEKDLGIVIIPKGDASDRLKRLACLALGCRRTSDAECTRVVEFDPQDDLRLIIRKLRAQDHVLLFDDSITTGVTLTALRRMIHRIGQEERKSLTVGALVALARPGSDRVLRSVKNTFGTRTLDEGRVGVFTNFRAVYEILFPAPGTACCPWCEEVRLINQYGDELTSASRQYADERLAALTGGASFEPWLGGKMEDFEGLKTLGSYFGELDLVTGFAAVGVTTYEVGCRLRTAWQGPQVDVFNVAAFLRNYFEDVFSAAVFRFLDPVQINYAGHERDLSDAVRQARDIARRLPEEMRTLLVSEIAWAAVTRKLSSRTGRDCLRESGCAGPVSAYLEEMIGLNE